MPSSPNYWGGFQERKSPWSSNEERLVDEALAAHTSMPREVIAQLPPPLPQVVVWRPRDGYGDAASRVPTIETALGVTRYIPDRRLDFSGSAGQYSGSARATNTDVPTSPNPY